jgi:hypothetical protein
MIYVGQSVTVYIQAHPSIGNRVSGTVVGYDQFGITIRANTTSRIYAFPLATLIAIEL